MRFVAAWLLVSGCGFTISTGTAPDDGRTGDGAGDGVIDMPIDSTIDMPDDNDDDDDTILDNADNCPLVANTDQHDEDGDDRGDKCDVCPQIAASVEQDMDGDGIGDLCDPRPSMAGDVLVRFDGFQTAGSTAPAPWTTIGGVASDWGVSGDLLRLDTNDTAHLLRMDAGGQHTTIDFELDASLPGSNVPSVTGIVNGDGNLTTFTACSVMHSEQLRRLQTFDNGSFSPVLSLSGPVTVPGTHRVIARIDAGTTICAFVPGGSLSTFVDPERTFVGLRVRNLRVAIKYIAVYRSP